MQIVILVEEFNQFIMIYHEILAGDFPLSIISLQIKKLFFSFPQKKKINHQL